MKKWIQLIAVSLAAIMLAGCNLIGTDTALDASLTVLKVGDQTVSKGQLANAWYNQMQQMAYQYQMYGMNFDVQDETMRKSVLQQTVDGFITYNVVQAKGKELGLDQFTPEETTAMDTDVQSQLNSYWDSTKSQYFADSALQGDALIAAINEKLIQQGITKDSLLESAKRTKISEHVRESVIKDVTVTPEDVAAEYQTKLAAQKESYEKDLTAYASDANNPETSYYVPAGYRYVKHVLIEFESEAKSSIESMQSELQTLRTNRTELQKSVDQAEGKSTDPTATPIPKLNAAQTEQYNKSIAEAKKQIAQYDIDIPAKEAELETAKAAAYEAIQPKVKEVQDKLALGLNFDQVVESYGQDPGMKSEPAKSTGYPVCAGLGTYDAAFQDASMALAKVGDVSEPVKSSFGYHIIKYVSDSVAHEVGLDAVKDNLSATMLTQRQDDAYSAAEKTWTDATKVVRYDDRMDFIDNIQ